MFLPNYNFIFNLTLIISSLVAVNFNSLFFTWVFMELNLLVVAPLLLVKSSAMKEQPTLILKYFMVQVVGSLFILMGLILIGHTVAPPMSVNLLVLLAVLLKAGIPPLHFWFPPILYLSSPYQAFTLLCPQKIIPLFLIGSLVSETLLSFVVLSALIGSLSGISQNSLMKIMAFSSMSHSSWIVSGMATAFVSGYFYFMVYTMVSWSILMLMQTSGVKFISELSLSNKTLSMKLMIILLIFTMSGTPPFIGFLSKIYVIKSLVWASFYLLVGALLLGSTISFFFYARLMVVMALFSFTSPKETKEAKTFNTMIVKAIMLNFSGIIILFLID